MVVYLLWLINQSGQQMLKVEFMDSSLVFGDLGRNRDLHLHFASVVFGVYSMTREITPNCPPLQSPGMQLIEAAEHNLHVFEAVSGVKFLLFTDPSTFNCDALFQELYILYVDFVVKNPFHTIDVAGIGQPIQIPAFEEAVKGTVQKYNEPVGRR